MDVMLTNKTGDELAKKVVIALNSLGILSKKIAFQFYGLERNITGEYKVVVTPCVLAGPAKTLPSDSQNGTRNYRWQINVFPACCGCTEQPSAGRVNETHILLEAYRAFQRAYFFLFTRRIFVVFWLYCVY